MQLLTISEKTQNANQFIGDIIGIFPDTHIFSDHEHDIFTIIHTDVTQEEIDAKRPAVKYVAVEGSPSQLNLVTMNELNEEVLIPITDDIKPRFDLRYENGEIIENYTRARTK